ncbi:MAG: peptidylprolyl isomerase [Cellvibrionaceae bacterium]
MLNQLIKSSLRLACFLVVYFSIVSLVNADDVLQLKIMTQKGKAEVLIKLLPEVAPKHIERIKTLANAGEYDNATFHRVIPGFMAQTGDVAFGKKDSYNDSKAGTGGSNYEDLYAELSEIPFKAGVVGMARQRYIHSANSQFFIMTSYHPNLNGRYTVVGVVLEGLDYIKQLKAGNQDKEQGKVTNPDYIISAKIISQS